MSTSHVFRRLNSNLAARQPIDNYFTYFKTQVTLRPLIYRQRNANTLLAMDLQDPETKQQVKPKNAIASVPKQNLIDYVKSIPNGSNEFFEWLKPWMKLTTRKKEIYQYFTARHLQTMLIQSCYIIGDYTRMVGYLYVQRPRFIQAKNSNIYDVDHFFNTLLMCSLQRGSILEFNDPSIAYKKVQQMWSNTVNKQQTNGLTSLLVNCYAKQQGFETQGLNQGLNQIEVNLPSLEPTNMENESHENLLNGNESLYMICRTILDYSPEQNVEITRFVNEYKALGNKAGKTTDIYDEYVVSMKKIWTAKKEERTARDGEKPVEQEQDSTTTKE
ncbi:similar to Saccharomyces cerevisiae YGR084C MRP13 Mitochondrial ribosomal protein of the small subunit [Maudiozyma saulgeensis]|uniref:Similar to Saccharomyces cerevisiae YGR084C MRP13 Mitochondrial ribosomal protein of the small subunit n=1 Tax=Maudiozyma saulgeensis TaxID=1789683 RepID=A0A1X7QX29_9SACH|nr:similar to Saccharomyces cerevisiae YGR084C MRP13 Mitochondrial ribosomal protein of the small subunit [Kazachstania saulgeensis]